MKRLRRGHVSLKGGAVQREKHAQNKKLERAPITKKMNALQAAKCAMGREQQQRIRRSAEQQCATTHAVIPSILRQASSTCRWSKQRSAFSLAERDIDAS